MTFEKYQSIQRYGTPEVQDINIGTCYIFPKIDGTNASVWLSEDGKMQTGSRTRQLSIFKDNAGFKAWAEKQPSLHSFLKDHPNYRLYGEWLVPHSLKTYRDSAWEDFYVFDVVDQTSRHLSYNDYQPLLEKHGVNYIPPIAIIKNPDYESLIKCLSPDKNNYLIEDGKGAGEGIVIKNYDFVNRHGRTSWAKIVTSEFKEKHHKVMGAPEVTVNKLIEEKIAEKYVTKALCEKTLAKIDVAEDGFRAKHIPHLLNTVYYDLVREDTWNFIKENKYPKIDFKTLKHFTFSRVKQHLPHLF